VDEFQKAAALEPPQYDLMLDWGLAYDCAGNPAQAIAKFREATTLHPSAHTYSQLGMEYGKSGKYAEALDALARAQRLDPGFSMTYKTLGDVYLAQGNPARARENYQRALNLDPNNGVARAALARLPNPPASHP